MSSEEESVEALRRSKLQVAHWRTDSHLPSASYFPVFFVALS
jgi:hypothetical protein